MRGESWWGPVFCGAGGGAPVGRQIKGFCMTFTSGGLARPLGPFNGDDRAEISFVNPGSRMIVGCMQENTGIKDTAHGGILVTVTNKNPSPWVEFF